MRVDIPLLRWYDARDHSLPWRAPAGTVPDPYRVWLSEIMLQQTTVGAVKPYFEAFVTRWPTVEALAAAEDGAVMSAWAGLGYYARARNLIAGARAMAERFPETEAELLRVPGIGRYTAAAIASIAFGRRAVVVDGNVERVVARLFAVETPLPRARAELYRLTDRITPAARVGDFAQAMMDLGRTVCTSRKPQCLLCPLSNLCAGKSDAYPRKTPKAATPERRAVAWWTESEGRILLVRRPATGLLGGMLALPSSLGSSPDSLASITAEGGAAPDEVALGTVTHVFTHFRLTLEVRKSGDLVQQGGEWWPLDRLKEAGLPVVFMKAASLALGRKDDA